MSDGPVHCPRCGDPFQWALTRGYHCPGCRLDWDGKFPVVDHVTPSELQEES